MERIECPKGHVYEMFKEDPPWWPDGAPICPICCKTWIYTHPNWSYVKKLKTMAKVRKWLEGSYVGHQKRVELRILPDMSERQRSDNGAKDSQDQSA